MFPNIVGDWKYWNGYNTVAVDTTVRGAFYGYGTRANTGVIGSSKNPYDSFEYLRVDASRSNGTYGKSSTVQPNSIRTFYIIKF